MRANLLEVFGERDPVWRAAAAEPIHASEVVFTDPVRWTFGPRDAPPAVTGIDVAVVVDGRIARLYTMLTDDDGPH